MSQREPCLVTGPKDGKSYEIPKEEVVSHLIVVPLGCGGTVFSGVAIHAHPCGLVWGATIWLVVCFAMSDEAFEALHGRFQDYLMPQALRDWEARRRVRPLKPTPRR